MGWNNIHDRLDAGFSWLGGDRRAFERYRRRSAEEDQVRNQILTNQAYRRAIERQTPLSPLHEPIPSNNRRCRLPNFQFQLGNPARGRVRFADDPHDPNAFGMRSWDSILGRNNAPRNYDWGPSPARLSQIRRHGTPLIRQRCEQTWGRNAGWSGGMYADPRSGGRWAR